jgi:FkbM family methyltransferase
MEMLKLNVGCGTASSQPSMEDLFLSDDLPISGRCSTVSFSECGQDKVVEAILTYLGIQTPSYLDIGANHPVNVSNSALFYKKGGNGVAVEANPHFAEIWQKFRPRDRFVNAAVLPNISGGGGVTLNIIDDFNQLNYINEMSQYAEFYGQKATKSIIVPAYNLNEIVDNYCNGVFPDYLSVDIEGYDLDVIRATDFSKNYPWVISTEARGDEISKVLCDKGFVPIMCAIDTFAVHESWTKFEQRFFMPF